MVKASSLSTFITPASLFRSSARFFRKHPWQFWLTLLSIALGSAVMIAVDLANNSAGASFNQSVDTVSSRMTHRLIQQKAPAAPSVQSNNLSTTHSGTSLDATFYARLRTEWGYRKSAPIVEGTFGIQGESFQLLGIDVFAEPLFSTPLTGDDQALSGNTFIQLLSQPHSVILSRRSADRLGMALDQPYTVQINGKQQQITLIDYFADDAGSALDSFILTDIASAQTLFKQTTTLSRIELILTPNEANQLSSRLPTGLSLHPIQADNNALQQMTSAFRTNLTAMSLLAMLVGAFLVYNTMTFSVLQRRKQFAVERMIGVTGRQLFLHILTEALILGLIGSVLGIVLGVILGQGLLILITRTINDLYSAVDLSVLLIQPLLIAKGMGIALISVLLATLAPAWEAAKVQPAMVNRASVLESHFSRMTPWFVAIGMLLMCVSALLLWGFNRSLIAGFVALFFMVIGYSLWVPWLIRLLLTFFAKLRGNMLTAMAIRGIQSSLSRTNLAIIALAIAVSATVGVGIMITSFRATVADWLGTTLQSDLYVSAHNEDTSRTTGKLENFWLPAIRKLDGIQSISTGNTLTLSRKGIPIPTLVLNTGQHSQAGFNIRQGDEKQAWQQYHAGEVVFVSEPFAYHQKLKVGDYFEMTDENQRTLNLRVGAVYQDYSATQGMIVMPPTMYQKLWLNHKHSKAMNESGKPSSSLKPQVGSSSRQTDHNSLPISSIGIVLKHDTNPEPIRNQLSKLAQQTTSPVVIRSNKQIRETSLEVFDRTFAITNVLRLLVILVAFVGVFSALMALFLEKAREYAVLRATGLTPRQLTQMVLIQTGIIGLLAGLLALPLGWAMSELLIHVINQRSFGWTMSRSFPTMIILQALLLSIGAALLASIYPVKRISRISISQGLRQ